MPERVQRHILDAPPDASQISAYRDEADAEDISIEVTYPAEDAEKRVVVSPRGTVVLLNDVSETTFNQSESAEEIAAALSG